MEDGHSCPSLSKRDGQECPSSLLLRDERNKKFVAPYLVITRAM